MAEYTAVFRAVADFLDAIQQGRKLGATFSDVEKKATRAGGAGATFGSRVAAGSRMAAKEMDRTGKTLSLGVTAPLVAVGTIGVRTFAKFETQIVSAGSKSGATADQLERMKKAALDTGNTTKFSATQAAEGLDELAAAGFNAEDAIRTLPAVTLAAQAANEDLGLTAKVTATAMNAFNIPVDKASHVADVFTNSLNTTALTLGGLEDALGQAGEIGPRFNQSLEDTVAVIGRLVDMGVPAASAGTAVRQALTSLSAPTMNANTLIDQLGLNLRNADGSMRPLPDLVRELQNGLAAGNPKIKEYAETIGMSDSQLKEWAKTNGVSAKQAFQIRTAVSQGGKAFQDYATKTLFGVEGAKAFSLAMSDGKPLIIDVAKESDKLNRLTQGLSLTMGRDAANAFVKAHTSGGQFRATAADAVQSVSALGLASDGTAKQIGAVFQKTTTQKVDNFTGSVETLAIKYVQVLQPALNSSLDTLTRWSTRLGNLADTDPGLVKLAVGFAGVVAAAGPALFLGGKFLGVVNGTGKAISVTRKALETGGTWLELYGEQASNAGRKVRGGLLTSVGKVTSFLGGPWGVAIGIGVAAVGAFVLGQKEAARETKRFTDSLTFQNGALDDNSRQMLASKLATEGTLTAAIKAGVSERDYTAALIDGGDARRRMIEQLEGVAREHSNATSSGRTFVANTDKTSLAATEAARTLREMGTGLDSSATSAKQAANATGQAASATANLGRQTDVTSTAQRDAATPSAQLGRAQTELKNKEEALSKATQELINKLTVLKRGALDQAAANDAWEQSVDDARASVKANGRTVDSNTEKGRANRRAIRDMASALGDKIVADAKAGKSTDQLSSALRTGRKRLEDSAVAAGYSRREARKMADQYLKTPDELRTYIKTPGSKEAKEEIKALQQRIKELKGKTTTVDTKIKFSADKLAATIIKKDYFNNPGAYQPKVAGGPIQNLSGRGRKGVDTEPVIAAVDEHMVANREVDRVGGHRQVYRIREGMATGDLRGYEPGDFAKARGLRAGGPVNRGPLNKGPRNVGAAKTVEAQTRFRGDRVPQKAVRELNPRLAAAAAIAGQKLAKKAADDFTAWMNGQGSEYTAAKAGNYGGTKFNAKQLRVAATIANVGAGLGFPRRGLQVALMTAMQESRLQELDYGDRDSVGPFQQRTPWGSRADRINASTSARMFFKGGKGGQRGLEDIKGWEKMSLGRAAQEVQVSGFPGAYTQWASAAAGILAGMGRSAGGGYAGTGSRKRVTWKGGTFTERFRNTLIAAEKRAGRSFRVMQGGFSTRVAASGSSHKGDAVDIGWDGGGPGNVSALRKTKVAAWHRTPAQGFVHHIHGIPLPGAGYPGGSGVWQAQDYLRGGNGLAAGSVATQADRLYLTGEEGPELIRTRSGSQVQTNQQTLDYLSRIEALAVKAPKDITRTAQPRMAPRPVEHRTVHQEINMPIYYPRADQVPTMAAQTQIVRAGRRVASRG